MRLSILVATGTIAAAGVGSFPPAASGACDTTAGASEQHVGQPSVDVAAGGLVQGATFVACNVTISPGTAVRWTITPPGGHTVTADATAPARFDFGGAGGTFTFTQPGSYFYYCMFHGTPGAPGTGMVGVVYVQSPGAPPPPRFAGVKVIGHTVRVSRTRVARVRVRCPAGTAGSCSGRLTLTSNGARLAGRRLSIAPGAVATVRLRLSRAELRRLVARRRLRVGLAIDVHDGNGTASGRRNERITLTAPRR